jgi:hypothetical protein
MPKRSTCNQAQEGESDDKEQKILAPGGWKLSLKKSKRSASVTPPREDPLKAMRPTGTLLMKESRKEDKIEDDSLKDTMNLHLDGLVKSDLKELSSDKDGDSIKRSIKAVWARLFKGGTQDSAELEEELESTAKSDKKKKTKQTSLVHVAKAGATPAAAKAKQGAVIAEGTQFNDKQSKPAKKTPGTINMSNLFTSVIRIKIKLFHGVLEVQIAIMALLDYCLTTLQERDKHARLLRHNKMEEAFKAKDLPQDFTDFYDKWGLWDKQTQTFLNTTPEGKSRSFSASFWFKCEMLPKTLFKKTFLKMSGQKKLKGSIIVEMKPCQHLDPAREIIFFQVPNCNATGLRGTLRKAMTKAKSGMIHKCPSKYPRMEWCNALPEFEMVRDFVKNTPWQNREEKSSIQAYHKTTWHLECPQQEVDLLYTILKVMKKNKSINKLFGDKALVIKTPGF